MQKAKSLEIIPQKNISKEELQLINSFSRRELTEDEVYIFSTVLCDNDVDRDFEYFTPDALEKMSELFVGVTGIYDHNPTAKNQVARIYCCTVEKDPIQKTAYGGEYFRLVAKAYMPRCEENNRLITLLDAGIQKEVSVGCSIGECCCSICGESMRSGNCEHIKGELYNGEICCGILSNPLDAYEWSFTAVPSQRKAGVIKNFSGFFNNTQLEGKSIFEKSVSDNGNVTVTCEDFERLKNYVEVLEKKSEQSDRYKSLLELETVKAGITARIEIESDLLEAMVKGLSIDELIRLKENFEKKTSDILPVHTQLAGRAVNEKTEFYTEKNSQYEI